MIVAEILTSIMGGYFVYMLQKIDKRQDNIEIKLATIEASIPKRFGDER